MLQPTDIIEQLHDNRPSFATLLDRVPVAMRTWRLAPEHWTLLEIVCHLHDEEREDFRARTASVVEHPERQFTPIDPQGWVTARRYAEQDYDERLAAFLRERDASVEWLRSVAPAAWDNTMVHPDRGPLPARLFLANWLAHDYLHIRQIMRVKYHFLAGHVDVPMDYAGSW